MNKGTNIRVPKEAHEAATNHIKPKEKLGEWTAEAIYEKIEREKNGDNPVLIRGEKFIAEIKKRKT